MNLGVVTICYNGYGKFLPTWARSVAALNPAEVTVALGPRHGLTSRQRDAVVTVLPRLTFCWATHETRPTMGRLRNLAVVRTYTKWIQYLSVDDVTLPNAMDVYRPLAPGADWISIAWLSQDLWRDDEKITRHRARVPEEMYEKHNGRGFINAQSPYRRWIWERQPYMEHDYPNAPFIAGAVESGARFVAAPEPTTVYRRRLDSHCGKNLGRRRPDGKRPVVLAEKRQAIFWKKDMETRIRRYYGGAGAS